MVLGTKSTVCFVAINVVFDIVDRIVLKHCTGVRPLCTGSSWYGNDEPIARVVCDEALNHL